MLWFIYHEVEIVSVLSLGIKEEGKRDGDGSLWLIHDLT